MDQVKIGKFIQALRKQKGLTQKELADNLLVSDKTVSKWETGNGLPEVSLMMPLCEILGVSVNELLSAEKLDEKQYYFKAEENVMSLVNEKKKNKKLMTLMVIIGVCALVACLTILIVGAYMGEKYIIVDDWVAYLLIGLGVVLLLVCIFALCIMDNSIGYFKCKHCGEVFVPTNKAYIMAVHGATWRRLKCPKCGKKSNCKKVLSKEE